MAILTLVILAAVLLLGLAALVGGIVGLCLIHKKPLQRKGLATGLLIALLAVGTLMLLLPIGIAGYALFANFQTLSGVMETGIVLVAT